MQNSSVDLRRLSARDTVAGDPGGSIQGINTFNLPDGAIVWCSETKCDYQLDRSSTQTGGGAVVPSAGPGRWFQVPAQSPAYIMQGTWYIDAVNGNDQNDGFTAGTALKTLTEFARRTYGRVLSPAIASFTVNLDGDFGFEQLQVSFLRGNPETVIRVVGTTTVVDSGTITAFQTQNAATNQRRQVTDATQDFTPHIGRRIRMTSGAASGLVTWISSLGGGATVANTGKFNWNQTGIDPAGGDTYVIEDMTTRCGGVVWNVADSSGDSAAGWNPSIESLAIVRESTRVFSGSLVLGFTEVIFRGCLFTVDLFNASAFYISGRVGAIACCNDSHVFVQQGFLNSYSFVHRARIGVTRGGVLAGSQSNMHDGNGVRNVSLAVDFGTVRDAGDRSFWGCPNDGAFYSYCAILYGSSQWGMTGSSAILWGNVGNAALAVVRVYNGAGVSYVTAPVASGATPGNDYVLAGGVPAAWGTLPALAASPSNAFFNLYQ